MIESILKGLLGYITTMANIMLLPINAVISSLFPDLNDYINAFYNFIDFYIVPNINYFFHLLPSNAMQLMLVYLSCIIAFYTITLVAHATIKVIEIIKNIKIW